MRRFLAVSLATAFLGFSLGSAVAQPAPPGYTNIPPPRFERQPPPRAGFLWEPGHWQWNGARYVWAYGRWVPRRAHYHEWVAGHWRWAPRLNRWVWEAPHWR